MLKALSRVAHSLHLLLHQKSRPTRIQMIYLPPIPELNVCLVNMCFDICSTLSEPAGCAMERNLCLAELNLHKAVFYQHKFVTYFHFDRLNLVCSWLELKRTLA